MNEENIKEIIKKYKEGTSSLAEEKFLFDSLGESDKGIKKWASFVKKNKKEIPKNLNNKLWESFENKTKKKNKFIFGVLSAVASITLIIFFYVGSLNQDELSNNEKEALLNEAKSMFQDSIKNTTIHRILLEDDLVVVYTKIE